MLNFFRDILRKYDRLTSAEKQRAWQWVETVVVLTIVLLFLLACLVSCKSPQVVTLTEYRDRVQHDTVQHVDSIYQYRYIYLQGDTVYIHDSIDRYRWRDKVVEVHIQDSVPYPVEVVREVKAPLNGWQRFIQGSGYALWGMLLIGLIALVIIIVIKIKG